jgi:hypothetical protein
MTAFFLGVQKAGKGDGEIAVAVVDGVHGPDHEGLSAFPWKERELRNLMLEIGQPDTEKPHRLLKLDRIQDIDRRLVVVIALADGGCQGLLFAEAGIKIGIPDIKADGFAGATGLSSMPSPISCSRWPMTPNFLFRISTGNRPRSPHVLIPRRFRRRSVREPMPHRS